MITEKRYGINFDNMDEVILEIARDIKNGYTFHSCRQSEEGIRLNVKMCDPGPFFYIYLKKKENP